MLNDQEINFQTLSYNRLVDNKASHSDDNVEPYTTPDLVEMCDLIKTQNLNINDIL